MSYVPPWQTDRDEEYWNAIVSQGRWSSPTVSADPPAHHELRPVTDAAVDARWVTLHQMFDEGTRVRLPVTGYNKGGLLVDWEGMQGFVPTSQLLNAPILAHDAERMDYLAGHVDEVLELKVIELDRAQNRIIFSQRAASWGDCCPDSRLDELCAGDICEGVVSNLCDFGVFVDLGGIDGLIHVSELSWRRVQHPRDVLTVGEPVSVYVIDVDHERRRIALSLKRLQPNPWATIHERYRPGMVVEGIVTNVVDFGAFARIEDGVEGLIHISELNDPDGLSGPVEPGRRVLVRILSVDPDHQRMALSLRGVGMEEAAASPLSTLETMVQDGAQSLH